MSNFHFLRPEWLWVFPLIIILAPLLWYVLQRQNAWQYLMPKHLSTHLLQGGNALSPRWPFFALMLALMITTLAASGPSWQRIEVPLYNQDRGAVIVLDASLATRAQDLTPDRFSRLNFKAIDIVNQYNEGQLGFIAYAGDAFTVTPLTRDGATILQSMRVLTPEMMPVAGNHPLLAMQEADRLLSAAGYTNGEIIWLTAGINREDMQELQQFFRTNSHRVSILGAGSREGAPVRNSEGDLVRDARGRVLIPQLIPEYLERIAAETNGNFQSIQTNNSDIEQLLAFPELVSPVSEALQEGDEWLDFGPWLLWLLLPLVLLAARRGVIWGVMLAVMILPPPVFALQQASTSANSTGNSEAVVTAASPAGALQRPFRTREQYAQDRYNEGDYATAAINFRDPLARGMAWYRAEDFARAANEFAAADSAEGYYNLGNSLANLGQLQEALAAYEQALALRPNWPAAEENAELVKALLEQQQDEQNESGEDGEQSDSNEQGEPEDSEQMSDSEQQQEPPTDFDNEDGANEEREQAEADAMDAAENELNEDETENGEAAAAQLDHLSEEEAAELEQLLRRVEDDPAILLRNRLQFEAQRRRFQSPPRGN